MAFDSNEGPMALLSTDCVDHHAYVLQEMTDLLNAESLTDVTFHCSGGSRLHAHRKILASVSPLIRKLATVQQRHHIIINDVSIRTAKHLLNILYTGYSGGMTKDDMDQVHVLCEMLGVTFSGGGMSVNPTEATTKLSTKSMPMGHGESAPSIWIEDQTSEHKTFCLCRGPEKTDMIGCDFCAEWFHYSCLNLTKDKASELAAQRWKCPNCVQNDDPVNDSHGDEEASEMPTSTNESLGDELQMPQKDVRIRLQKIEDGIDGWSKVSDDCWMPTADVECLTEETVEPVSSEQTESENQTESTNHRLKNPTKLKKYKSAGTLNTKEPLICKLGQLKKMKNEEKSTTKNGEKLDRKRKRESVESTETNQAETPEQPQSVKKRGRGRPPKKKKVDSTPVVHKPQLGSSPSQQKSSKDSQNGDEREESSTSLDPIFTADTLPNDTTTAVKMAVEKDVEKGPKPIKKSPKEVNDVPLFYCYACLGIFITSDALKKHKIETDHD